MTPLFLQVIFGFACEAYSQLTYIRGSTNTEYFYPPWAITAGWSLAVSSVTMIPLYAFVRIICAKGTLREVSWVYISHCC